MGNLVVAGIPKHGRAMIGSSTVRRVAAAVGGKRGSRSLSSTRAAAPRKRRPSSNPPVLLSELNLDGHMLPFSFTSETFDDADLRGASAADVDPPCINLVAVHGAPGSVEDFRYLSPQLEAAARATATPLRFVRLDLPGHGATPAYLPHAHGAYSTATMADFVSAAARHLLPGQDFVVLGHSLGGPVAVKVGVSSPECRAVALVNPVCVRPHRMVRPLFVDGTTVANPTMRALYSIINPVYDGPLPWWAQLLVPPLRPILRPLLEWAMVDMFTKSGFKGMTIDDIVHSSHRVLGQVDIWGDAQRNAEALARPTGSGHPEGFRAKPKPTLVAYAKDDKLIEERRFKELIELLPPHGEEVAFETGGHNCQATQAEVLAKRLVSFCASCRPSRQ